MKKASFSKHGAIEMLVENSRAQQHQLNTAYYKPFDIDYYYIPITDTALELSVFWLSDTESRINELRFSQSISLFFKMRLTSVTCFCGDVT